MTPPVTPEPLSAFTAEQVRATALKWRKAADSIAATSRDRETADMLDAFADLLEARAARLSPWQPIDTCPLDEVVCFNVVGVMRDPMNCGGRVLRTPEGQIIHGATGWRPRPQAMPQPAPPAPPAQDGGLT